MAEKDFEWDEEIQLDNETSYQALLRGIKRAQGFCLQFVQCTPIKAKEIIGRLESDLVGIKTAKLVINTNTENFYEQLKERYQVEKFDLLFVQGFEDPMLAYEQQNCVDILELSRQEKYGGKDPNSRPLILGALNLSREKLRDSFPLSMVFFLPDFALNYFIHCAPDFFDWRSNIFKFSTKLDLVNTVCEKITSENFLKKFSGLNGLEKFAEIIDGQLSSYDAQSGISKLKEIASYIQDVQDPTMLAELWFQKSLIHAYEENEDAAFRALKKALQIKPSNLILLFLDIFFTYEQKGEKEAIFLLDEAIHSTPENHELLFLKGGFLDSLEHYEEAITSYDKAIEISPSSHHVWNRRGLTLKNLERYEEALVSYDKALKINLDSHNLWNRRGLTLNDLERYEEELVSYDKALRIKSDCDYVWHNRGSALKNLDCYEEAITSYDKALKIKPDSHYSWNERGLSFAYLERYEEAIHSYNKAIESKPDYATAYYNKACSFALQTKVEPALEFLEKAIELDSDYYQNLMKTDSDFDSIRDDPRFQALIL